jgi:hypothetical protein
VKRRRQIAAIVAICGFVVAAAASWTASVMSRQYNQQLQQLKTACENGPFDWSDRDHPRPLITPEKLARDASIAIEFERLGFEPTDQFPPGTEATPEPVSSGHAEKRLKSQKDDPWARAIPVGPANVQTPIANPFDSVDISGAGAKPNPFDEANPVPDTSPEIVAACDPERPAFDSSTESMKLILDAQNRTELWDEVGWLVPLLISIGLSVPWLWYFLLTRIGELSDAIRGRS